jgi:hypothetical protein
MREKVFYIFLLGIVSFVTFSCNPVKRVLTTPKYYAQVKREVILRGECANDTVTQEILKDTIIYKDTVIHDSFKVNMPMECHIDTIVNDFSVYIENGNMWVKWLGQIPTRIKEQKITHTVVDRAKEAILLDSCANQSRQIYGLNNKISTHRKEKFKLFAIIAILIIILFRKPLLRLVKPF